MMPLLEAQHLKKYFKTPEGMLHAVDDVSFMIQGKSTLGVVGESGCGKSTLGRTVLHLLESTGGNIFYEGENITHVSKDGLKALRRNMQMIFQDPFSSLNPRMTTQNIISEPLKIYGLCKGKGELVDRTAQLMETVGLSPRLTSSYPHELDGGRRQRIGIARALALNPKFVVCDEPVSSLDVSIQAQILNLMMDLQEQKNLTYMFITHNLSVVKHISDEIAVMYLGKIVEQADADELFGHPLHPYTQALLSAIPVPDCDYQRERTLIKGEVSSAIEPKACCRFAARCSHTKDVCLSTEPAAREVSTNHIVACHLV